MSNEATVTVKRGGSYLTISADSVERYMAKGYDVVDANDNIIKACVPNDVDVLKKAFSDHTNRIKELEEEVKSLKAKLAEKAKPVAAKVEPVKEETVTVEKAQKNIESKSSTTRKAATKK